MGIIAEREQNIVSFKQKSWLGTQTVLDIGKKSKELKQKMKSRKTYLKTCCFLSLKKRRNVLKICLG